jgi:hypothetical protein
MPDRPDHTLPRREKSEETRRDWEPIQVNTGGDTTERLRISGGWLYSRTGVGMVFVPAQLDDDTAG